MRFEDEPAKSLAEAIESELLPDEKIEAAVIGEFQRFFGPERASREIPPTATGKVLSWDEAKKYLGYRWNGDSDVHALYVWTDKRIGLVTEYDSSTNLIWLPRNPIDCDPETP